MKHINRLWVVVFTSLGFQAIAQTTSLVYEDGNGSLAYGTYANQGQANAVNTVPDFSNTGYKGGGVPIPFIPKVVTVSAPSGGDDTTLIQNAIDAVANMPLQSNGFRGAVLIKAGNYQVASTLNITHSGIVIRGEGSQNNGGTQITMTATIQDNLFHVSGGGSAPSLVSGSTKTITDSFVPVGARSFNVDSTAGYSVGDKIQIEYNINDLWIQDLGMNLLNAADPAATDWTAAGYQLLYERVVTAINGNRVTFDSPLVQAIEDQYGGAIVSRYTFSGKISNIGFENLRLESTYTSEEDENHGWTGIQFNRVQDAWMRQVTGQYFGMGLVSITGYSHHITIEDCAMLDPKSITTGGRKYSFNLNNASHVMMQRCYTRGGRHDYVSGAKTPGPNVFVDCVAENASTDAGPHHRYATGQLYDNVNCGYLNVHNRFTNGSGHGWSGAQVMFWNCVAISIICDAPNAAMNWSVGCVATHKQSWGKVEPNGIWQSHNTHVTPRSLYYRQLQERLGLTALRNVIIPEQESGPIWTALSTWAGEGRFSNGVIAWASDTLPSIPNDTITLTGRIRNFEILERGATTNWSKVSGPGSITFGTASQLETTATFSTPGIYVMRLSVNDGVATTTLDLTVRYGNTAPVAHAGVDQLIVISPSDPWIPTDLSPAAWYDASDAATITASAGVVSQWNDKSGNNNHASQATAGNRPTNNNATIGGLAAISFRVANQQHLRAANHASLNLDGLGGSNVFAVMNYKSYVNQTSSLNAALAKGPLLSTSSSYGIRISSSSQLSYQGGSNAQAITNSSINQNLIYGGTGNVAGKTSTIYVNGDEKISATSATTFTSDNSDPLYIGRDPSSTRYADVDFGEIVIAGGVITNSDRQKIEGYLAHKWGLEANLPVGHPYLSSAPNNASATISLDGTASDGDGDPITRTWSVFSGPAPVTFGNASAADTTAMFTTAGTYTLRLTVNDGYETSTDNVVVTVLENSPYNTWVVDNFTGSSNNTTLIGNSDGDSWINLQEFAFGMNPSSPTTQTLTYTPGGGISSPGPPVIVNFATAGQINDFRAVFVRRKNRVSAGLNYTVYFSADLGLWTISATTPTVLSNDPGDLEVVSVPYPASVGLQSGGSVAPKFFRVGISSN